MRAIIVGGGIAGLAAASFLAEDGVEVVVLEKAARWERAGYGISLWNDGIAVLEDLGVRERFREVGTPIERWTLQDGAGRTLAEIGLEYGPEARPLTAVHRGDLHQVLRERAGDVPIRMGVVPSDIDLAEDRVRVRTDDGTTLEADVLIGADGVRSVVRDACLPDAELVDTGTAVWSHWVPSGVDVPTGFTEQWGEDGRALLIAPIAEGHMASLAAPAPKERLGAPLTSLREQAAAGGPLLSHIVDQLPNNAKVFHDRLLEVEAPMWSKGRVVVIGDAAHAVHPIVGMGATLALEDASVLADVLAEPVPEALAAFEEARRGPVDRLHREAAVTRAVTFAEADALTSIRNWLVRHSPLMEMFMRQQVDDEDVTIRRLD